MKGEDLIKLLADGFTRKNFTMFIITDMIQVHTITDKIIPLQSGGTLS